MQIQLSVMLKKKGGGDSCIVVRNKAILFQYNKIHCRIVYDLVKH